MFVLKIFFFSLDPIRLSMYMCCVLVTQSCLTLDPMEYGMQPARLLCPGDFPGKNTGVDSHFLLQGIFLTQELNPGLLYYRQILSHLSHQGSTHYMCLYIYIYMNISYI